MTGYKHAIYTETMYPKNAQKDSIIERVFTYICNNELIQRGKTLVAGVSGGPDSVCLLHILARLQERLDIKLHVAHLNHLLRGSESEADAEYVSNLAKELCINATVEQRDVETYRAKHRLSLEEAAREVRYLFFAEVASSSGTDRIALGHTANDQAETILMHLIRGSGIHGLQGMHPLTQLQSLTDSRLTVVRPFLQIRRKEIEEYCQYHSLTPRNDSSNLSASFLRNRIRSELIPLLRRYNPRIDDALLRTADSMAIDLSFFSQQVSLMWDRVVKEEEGRLVLRFGEVTSLHPALQRYLLREAIRHLLGNLKDIEGKHIEQMRSAFEMKPGKRLILPRGLIFYVKRGEYRITRD